MPFISVFIPAYKNAHFLERLLISINEQKYTDYEVIITDDSPDSEVEELVSFYTLNKDNWHYTRNNPAKGMPQNWNCGLSKCQGEWVKIMHDDDYFSSDKSLETFANTAKKSNSLFIFSAYGNVYSDGRIEEKKISSYRKSMLEKEPMILLSDNVIGPPSVCLVHSSINELYDERLRWRVDIDYYVRVLSSSKGFDFIPIPLVKVGINEDQVTHKVKNIRSVELPEASILLTKYGTKSLKNILVFDSWWRFIRNLEIKNNSLLEEFTPKMNWPIIIKNIVKDANKFPSKILKIGILSKVAMFFSYFKNYKQIDA